PTATDSLHSGGGAMGRSVLLGGDGVEAHGRERYPRPACYAPYVPAPLIGVSTSLTIGEDSQRAYVNAAYLGPVQPARGVPVLLAPQPSPSARDALWSRLDGLVLTGGGDVEPSRFGQAPHPKTALVSGERDALEIELVDRALRDDVPMFAICRGLQVLNVAL